MSDMETSPPVLDERLFTARVILVSVTVFILVMILVLLLYIYAHRCRRSSMVITSRPVSARRYVTVLGRHEGLEQDIINRLPTFVCETSVRSLPECAICLSNFQGNERGRLLPSCGHVFHTKCIDVWLFSQSTCPLCRTAVRTLSSNGERQQATQVMKLLLAAGILQDVEQADGGATLAVQSPSFSDTHRLEGDQSRGCPRSEKFCCAIGGYVESLEFIGLRCRQISLS
ncbi:hypothetical protein KP509_31G024600 [Ceratopteris richardii]|uniref:RING-type E3 ubiquitin transferase n=1 Tax=Ceratopteris richardii TaxID=49495 RepID=A0A8T2QWA5_CERRI|nr:hypothetical protein KP509_31G024600 [Ceratopteris richardii]